MCVRVSEQTSDMLQVPCERVRTLLTSWTFFALLGLLPLGQLGEGLGCLLKFGDEELDVVQDVVQDLLPK